jgi:hypothetical protein
MRRLTPILILVSLLSVTSSALADEQAEARAPVTFVKIAMHATGKTETATHFKYPDVKAVDVECAFDVQAATSGVSLDAAALDADDSEIAHEVRKVDLEKGARSVVFKEFIHLADLFGKGRIRVRVAMTAPDEPVVTLTATADVEGAEEPSVQLLDAWPAPVGMAAPFSYFSPGDRFQMLFHYQVIESAGDRQPTLKVLATVDNEFPDVERARPHETWWGETKVPGKPGYYEVTVRGTVPTHFQNYDLSTHKLTFTYRLYYNRKVGWDGRTSFDLFDQTPGLSRQSSFDEDLWVKVDHAYRWRAREIKQDEYFASHNSWVKE